MIVLFVIASAFYDSTVVLSRSMCPILYVIASAFIDSTVCIGIYGLEIRLFDYVYFTSGFFYFIIFKLGNIELILVQFYNF